ncbi:uncharacterized protein LOC144450759 [Glandiceps talaboti]
MMSLNLSKRRLRDLPANVFEKTSLTELNINQNILTDLPDELARLTNLSTLLLRKNQFKTLPGVLNSLTKLEVLDLGANCFDSDRLLMSQVCLKNLTELRELYLDNNGLTAVDEILFELPKLGKLDLGNNNLTTLPSLQICPENLKLLYLNNNAFSELPSSLMKLRKIEELSLNYNFLSDLSEEIATMTKLQKLYAVSNQIRSITPRISMLTNLIELDLSSNQLEHLPVGIGRLTNLQYLNVSCNCLKDLTASVFEMENLTELNVNNNQSLHTFPEIQRKSNLSRLSATNCKIGSLSGKNLENLANLEYFDVSFNCLQKIPQEIGEMKFLRVLLINVNPKLTILPNEITELQALRHLDVSECSLKKLPKKFFEKLKNTNLNLKNNSLDSASAGDCDRSSLEKSVHDSGAKGRREKFRKSRIGSEYDTDMFMKSLDKDKSFQLALPGHFILTIGPGDVKKKTELLVARVDDFVKMPTRRPHEEYESDIIDIFVDNKFAKKVTLGLKRVHDDATREAVFLQSNDDGFNWKQMPTVKRSLNKEGNCVETSITSSALYIVMSRPNEKHFKIGKDDDETTHDLVGGVSIIVPSNAVDKTTCATVEICTAEKEIDENIQDFASYFTGKPVIFGPMLFVKPRGTTDHHILFTKPVTVRLPLPGVPADMRNMGIYILKLEHEDGSWRDVTNCIVPRPKIMNGYVVFKIATFSGCTAEVNLENDSDMAVSCQNERYNATRERTFIVNFMLLQHVRDPMKLYLDILRKGDGQTKRRELEKKGYCTFDKGNNPFSDECKLQDGSKIGYDVDDDFILAGRRRSKPFHAGLDNGWTVRAKPKDKSIRERMEGTITFMKNDYEESYQYGVGYEDQRGVITELEFILPEGQLQATAMTRTDVEGLTAEVVFDFLASKMPEKDWMSFARRQLRVEDCVIDTVTADFPHKTSEQIYRVFMKWYQGSDDHNIANVIERVCVCLDNHELRMVADQLRDFISQRRRESCDVGNVAYDDDEVMEESEGTVEEQPYTLSSEVKVYSPTVKVPTTEQGGRSTTQPVRRLSTQSSQSQISEQERELEKVYNYTVHRLRPQMWNQLSQKLINEDMIVPKDKVNSLSNIFSRWVCKRPKSVRLFIKAMSKADLLDLVESLEGRFGYFEIWKEPRQRQKTRLLSASK